MTEISFFYLEKKEELNRHPFRCLCILYHLRILFYIVISAFFLSKKLIKKERMDPIPYIEH